MCVDYLRLYYSNYSRVGYYFDTLKINKKTLLHVVFSEKKNVNANFTTLVRFLCPPDIPLIRAPPIITSAQSKSPKLDKVFSTNSSISVFEYSEGNRRLALNVSASLGVEVAINASSCITYAILDRNSTGFIFMSPTLKLPWMFIPEALADRPARTLSKELLPEPEGP